MSLLASTLITTTSTFSTTPTSEVALTTRVRPRSARLYEFTSKNDIALSVVTYERGECAQRLPKVRILGIPGLADTRSPQQDEFHKQSIEMGIKNHVGCISAVLVLANGTVPRVTVGTDYVLSTLSAIFPNTLTNNIAFVFTDVSSPLHWNFSRDPVLIVLKNAPQFLLNNSIAPQKKYLKLKNDPKMKMERDSRRIAVGTVEENALERLADLLDWLDGLEPQPTMKINPPCVTYGKDKADTAESRVPTGKMAAKEAKRSTVRCSTYLHLVWGPKLIIIWNRL